MGKKFLKNVFLFLVVPAVLILGAAGLGLFLLNHPQYGQAVLRKAVNSVNSDSLKITYERGTFQLFDRLALENVKIETRETNKVDIEVAKIDLKYSLLSLFSRKLLINKVLLENVFVKGEIRSPSNAPSEKSKPLDLRAFDKAGYSSFLKKIDVTSAELKNINVDLDLVEGKQRKKLLIDQFDLNSSLSSSLGTLGQKKWIFASSSNVAIKKIVFDGLWIESTKLDFKIEKEKRFNFQWNAQGKALGRQLNLQGQASSIEKSDSIDVDFGANLGGEEVLALNGVIQTSPRLELRLQLSSFLSSEFYSVLQLQEAKQQVGLLKVDGDLAIVSKNSAKNIMIDGQPIWPLEVKTEFNVDQRTSKHENSHADQKNDPQVTESSATPLQIQLQKVNGKLSGHIENLEQMSLKLFLSAQELAHSTGSVKKMSSETQIKMASSFLKVVHTIRGEFAVKNLFSKRAPLTLVAEVENAEYLQRQPWRVGLKVRSNNDEVFRLKTDIQDKKNEFHIELVELMATADEGLSFFSSYDLLSPYLPVTVSVVGNAHLRHQKKTIHEVKDFSNLLGQTDLTVEVSPLQRKKLFSVKKTTRGAVKVSRTEGRVDADVSIEQPLFEWGRKATVENSQVRASWNSAWPLNGDHSLSAQLKVKDIVLKKELLEELEKESSIGGIDVALKAGFSEKGPWSLNSLDLSIFNGIIGGTAQGRGNRVTENGALSGGFSLNSKQKKLSVPGLDVEGSLEFPWSVALQGGNRLNFDGRLRFRDFSFNYDKIQMSGVSGPLRVIEKLEKSEDEWQLTEVLQRNPFEKVDFERFQPFIREAEPFAIQKVVFYDKEIGPMTGFLALNQNLLSAQNFFLSTPSGGAAGEFFVDFYPGQRAMGLLARFDDIRFSELLPASMMGGRIASDKGLTGRSAFVYSLSNATLEGRVDVFRLSKGHMLTVIDVLDPNLQNQKFNLARKGLSVGHPKGLSAALDQGVLDLELSLGGPISALGLANPIRVPSLPVSSVVSKVSHEMDVILKGQSQ